jgi:hypothetical protein
VKTDLTTYGSLLQSQNKAQKLKAAPVAKSDLKIADPSALKKMSGPDYKVDLSTSSGSLPTPPTPSLPSLDLPKPKLPESSSKPETPEIKKPDIKDVSEITEAPVKKGSIKKPAIVFIKGLDLFSSPSTSESGYAGVGKIAEAIEGSRIYGWDQQDEILEYIERVHKDQPVVLVGHSFGGDTAMEIADSLDSLDYGFRKVDLLITIDAVGADNDIVPQNVKNHLNVFGENNIVLNDGPHVARRHEMTQVKNILSPLDHMDLDDDKEVQFEIVNLINQTLKS